MEATQASYAATKNMQNIVFIFLNSTFSVRISKAETNCISQHTFCWKQPGTQMHPSDMLLQTVVQEEPQETQGHPTAAQSSRPVSEGQ